jgi:hypothetical protein
LVLNKVFISNNFTDTEKADVILYPRIPNSIKSNDFVICNTENLINKLLKDFEKDKNIIQNIDPHALPRPGIREKDDVPNTIQFHNSLFHMQRKSSGGKEQTNLLVQVNLKKLDSIQKTVRKLINQKIAGINQFKNQIDFREKLKEIYSQEDLDNYIIRSSPTNYELAKVNFSSFWIDNKSKFDLFEINERDFSDGMNYILGTPGYSPTDAFHNNKIEKISKNDLLNLKTLPYFYLKGSIRQEIKKFFDKNIRLFLEILIFNNNENNFIGIIHNTSRYKETQQLNTKKLDKEKILDYAVERYKEQTFTKKTKSLDLGICCLKKYGGGGVKATSKAKSALVLALKNKALDRIY